MRTKTKAGRTFEGRGISAPSEVWDWVDSRIEDLKPRVSSASHYIQCLIDADKKFDVISIEFASKATRKSSS